MELHAIFRADIKLQGDLDLAMLELEALGCTDLDFINSVGDFAPVGLENSFQPDEMEDQGLLRGQSPYGIRFRCSSIEHILEISRRASFIQSMYSNEAISNAISSPLIRYGDSSSCMVAVSSMAVLECCGYLANRNPKEITRDRFPELVEDVFDLLLLKSRSYPRLVMKSLSANASSFLTHGLHYYKAKFFPRMARCGINLCIRENSVASRHVLDNFVGSGTTILEAILMGADATGIDVDPVSALISRVKSNVLFSEQNTLESCQEIIDSVFSESDLLQMDEIEFPDWLRRNKKWTEAREDEFSRYITLCRKIISSSHDSMQHEILSVICSNALTKKLKFRFLGTGSGRFSLEFPKTPLENTMKKSIQTLLRQILVFNLVQKRLQLHIGNWEILIQDCTESLPGTYTDLMTSPPYLPSSSGRESYTKSRVLSHLALGYVQADSIDELSKLVVGSMSSGENGLIHGSGSGEASIAWVEQDELRSVKAPAMRRYFSDMRQSFEVLSKCMAPGSRCVYVSGKESVFYKNNETRDILHVCPSAKILAELAKSSGHEIERMVDVQLKKENPNARPRSRDDYFETLIITKVEN